jgi:hypothetical protein
VADCPARKRPIRGVSQARGLNYRVPRPAIFTRSAYRRAGGFLTSARIDDKLGKGGRGRVIEIVSRDHNHFIRAKPHWKGPAEDTSEAPSLSFLNDNSAFSSPLRSSCLQLCNNFCTNQTTTIFDLRLQLLLTPHPSADPYLPASS